jgi:hypothetical protein
VLTPDTLKLQRVTGEIRDLHAGQGNDGATGSLKPDDDFVAPSPLGHHVRADHGELRRPRGSPSDISRRLVGRSGAAS